MGQAKLRGSLSERIAAAAGRDPKPTKDELRMQEMLSRQDVPEGYVGVAVHEKGRLVAVHHFPVEDFAEGRAIPSSLAVQKMKGVLKGDPTVDPKAFHYLRHAGLDRLRARQHVGWGFLLWTVVNDPQIGAQVTERIRAEVERAARAGLLLVAVEGGLTVAAGSGLPDLKDPEGLAASADRMVATVPLTYSLR